MSNPGDTHATPAASTTSKSKIGGYLTVRNVVVSAGVIFVLLVIVSVIWRQFVGPTVTVTATTDQTEIQQLRKQLADLKAQPARKPAADPASVNVVGEDSAPNAAADAGAENEAVPPAADNGNGNAACRLHKDDYLGTDGRCHPKGIKSNSLHVNPGEASEDEKTRFAEYANLCKEQAEKRKRLGLTGEMNLTGGPGQKSTCHVEGGLVENGRI